MRGAPPCPPQPGLAVVKAHIDTLLTSLKVPRIDVVIVNAGGDPMHLCAVKEAKMEGRVRYIGLQAIGGPMNAQLESIMLNEMVAQRPLRARGHHAPSGVGRRF